MVPENLRFGGGVAGTVFNPVVAAVVVLIGILMCCLPRNKAIVPFLLGCILIPSDQILVVAGLHFPLLRILIFFGMIRIFIIRGSGKWRLFSGGVNGLDKSLVLLSIVSAVAGVLLLRTGQAVTFELGEVWTALGAYFLLRYLIRDDEDVVRVIRIFAIVVVVLGVVMLTERLMRGWNPYTLLGGARAQNYAADMMRGGVVRAMGSFAQPILAGTFGAVMVSLFIGLWLWKKEYRGSAIFGIAGAMLMMVSSNSSTPLMGCLAGLVGLCLWPIRSAMRLVRWGIIATLIGLQLVMTSPVWHIITHFDISGSSYHRYELIDQCIRHFWDWWLVGTNSNANWGWDMWDTANQYVSDAYHGGLLGLVCFIAIIAYGFKYLGRARKAATDKKQALFFWALGATLLAYVVSFFGISLWDQSIVGWYLLLAIISAVAVPQRAKAAVPVEPIWSVKLPPKVVDVPVGLHGRERSPTAQQQVHASWQRHSNER